MRVLRLLCVSGLLGGGCVSRPKSETPIGVQHEPYHAKPAYLVVGPDAQLKRESTSPRSSPLHISAPAEGEAPTPEPAVAAPSEAPPPDPDHP